VHGDNHTDLHGTANLLPECFVDPTEARKGTSSVGKSTSIATENLSEVTTTPSSVCTSVCTKGGETADADLLADFVAGLTPEQRRRLAALLAGQSEGDAS
jgi:hypothetical protein